MNFIEFLSQRFETKLKGPITFGDEVIDKYGIKAVVIRDPYPLGADKELFTSIYYGNHLSTARISNLTKTGKSYAKELNTIFEHLKEEDSK